MSWMVFSELVPDALQETSPNTVAVVVTLSAAAMTALQFLVRWRFAPSPVRGSGPRS